MTKQVENNQARKIDSGSLAWPRALRYKGAIEFRLLSSFYQEFENWRIMDEQLTAIIIKGKVHRLTVMPDDEPCLCKECSLQELCDRLEERILCDFIGDCRGHHIFKCDNLKD